jgi:hypothetical protein
VQLLGTFETISELAIALTGFTGVVVVFGGRRLGNWSDFERFGFRSLLYWSLGTVFLALVPSGLTSLGESVPEPWRVAHALFAIFHGWVYIWFFRELRAMGSSLPPSRWGSVIIVIGLGVLLAEILVALGFFQQVAPFLYLVALVWFLFLAANSFAMLILGAPPADPPAA